MSTGTLKFVGEYFFVNLMNISNDGILAFFFFSEQFSEELKVLTMIPYFKFHFCPHLRIFVHI